MSLEAILSGAGGAGGAGALLFYLIRRALSSNDLAAKDQNTKIDKIIESISDLRVEMARSEAWRQALAEERSTMRDLTGRITALEKAVERLSAQQSVPRQIGQP